MALSPQSKTNDWLKALSNAVSEQFPPGIRETQGLKLLSANGSQATSVKFMATCRVMEITQIFTSYNNPKGNADTERVIRTTKEDLIWPRDWFSFEQLNLALNRWVKDYNEDFPHSAINYKTPVQFEQEFLIQNTKNLSQTFC